MASFVNHGYPPRTAGREDKDVSTDKTLASRIEAVVTLFDQEFGTAGRRLLQVVSPGRTEIAGNHTDHEGGHVIAAALDASFMGVAATNGTNEVHLVSVGFDPITVSLEALDPRADERVTTAGLVRGMASLMAGTGRTPAGFDLVLQSNVPSGGGLSSSAALELALGRAMEALWEGPAVSAASMARMGQLAEQKWFGKPCGLMDQMAVAQGAVCFMDFFDEGNPKIQRIDFDFAQAGYAICLTDVGCDHSVFTDEYAAVPAEMHAVAAELGVDRLAEAPQESFEAAVATLRKSLGDRAVTRGIHYYLEEQLVDQRRDALVAGEVDGFLELTRRSGASSAMYLQNVGTGGSYQPAMVALGLAELVLDGRGAVRIHGGGFGGTIQAFVPLAATDEYCARMDGWFGTGSTHVYNVAEKGAYAQWM